MTELRDVLRGLRCVQAGWAFGVPDEDAREQWLDLVCDAITTWQATPPGWTRLGTTEHGGTLYTAPPGTPPPGDPP